MSKFHRGEVWVDEYREPCIINHPLYDRSRTQTLGLIDLLPRLRAQPLLLTPEPEELTMIDGALAALTKTARDCVLDDRHRIRLTQVRRQGIILFGTITVRGLTIGDVPLSRIDLIPAWTPI